MWWGSQWKDVGTLQLPLNFSFICVYLFFDYKVIFHVSLEAWNDTNSFSLCKWINHFACKIQTFIDSYMITDWPKMISTVVKLTGLPWPSFSNFRLNQMCFRLHVHLNVFNFETLFNSSVRERERPLCTSWSGLVTPPHRCWFNSIDVNFKCQFDKYKTSVKYRVKTNLVGKSPLPVISQTGYW